MENDRRKYFMINLHERMLPTSAGVEPATSWSPVGRRIQLSHRGRRNERLILRSLRSLFTPDALVGLWLRKETLENMRTAKIQTSLCIHVDWSGSSLFACKVKGPCGRYRTNSEDLDPSSECANWSGALLFVYALRTFLSAGCPNFNLVLLNKLRCHAHF